MNGPTLSHARSHVVRLPRSNLDEIVPCGDGFNFRVQALVDSAGNEMSVPMGDGSKAKPLKCEWSTQKDGKMLIGSTGKERTDDDGNVVHEGEMCAPPAARPLDASPQRAAIARRPQRAATARVARMRGLMAWRDGLA